MTAEHNRPTIGSGLTDNQVDEIVGKNLRQARRAAGINQQQLADALGLTFQQVQKYERGANRMSASMMLKAAEKCQISVSALYTGIDTPAIEFKIAQAEALLRTEDVQLAEKINGLPIPQRNAIIGIIEALKLTP